MAWASLRDSTSCTSVDLPEPDTPVTQMNLPSGNSTVKSFRLFSLRPFDDDALAVALASLLRHRDAALAAQELGGDRIGVVQYLLVGALGYHLPAMLARARPDVDDPVGHSHGLFVVLHHDQGIAKVSQPDAGC